MTNPHFEDTDIDWGTPLAEWDETLPASRDAVVGEFRDRSLSGTVFAPDAAQNFIVGWGFNLAHSNAGGASFVRKDRTGTVTGAWTVNTPDDQKPDDMGGGQTGTDLAVVVLTHEPISSDTRRNRIYLGLLRDVLVAYPAGQPPLGGYVPREALGGGTAPAPSDPVDYAQIRAIVQGEIAALVGLFGGGSLRGGLQQKGEDSLVAVMTRAHMGDPTDPRVATFQAAFSDTLYQSPGLYQRLKETVYEVLHDAGIIKEAPTP